jgi:hypothetical protein
VSKGCCGVVASPPTLGGPTVSEANGAGPSFSCDRPFSSPQLSSPKKVVLLSSVQGNGKRWFQLLAGWAFVLSLPASVLFLALPSPLSHSKEKEREDEHTQLEAMDFGSKALVHLPADDLAPEDIYSDEVNDGIANCAKEQAEVWAAAAKEEADGNNVDVGADGQAAQPWLGREFLDDLAELTRVLGSQRSGGDSGGRAGPAGAFGTATRLQPRMQTGMQAQFDAQVCPPSPLSLSLFFVSSAEL